MENPSDTSPAVLSKKTATFCHWLLLSLLAIAFALELDSYFQPMTFSIWLDTAFIALAALSTLASLWRRLPLQNVLLAAVVIAAIGSGFSAFGAKFNLPFGPFVYTSGIGPLLFKVLPWPVPLIWVIIILNSRGVARLILRPWRKTKAYGYRAIALTAILVLLFDVAFEPFASQVKHLWLWLPTVLPLTWQGASVVNFVSWMFITVLILLFVTPVMISKKPRAKTGPDFHPLCVWVGGLIVFGTGCAIHGFWAPVMVDAVIGVGALIFALRGAWW